MERELWTKTDLLNAIAAAYFHANNPILAPTDKEQITYLRGYRAALATLALAFGLPALPVSEPDARAAFGQMLRE